MRNTLTLAIVVFLSGVARAAVPDGTEFTQLRMNYASRPDAMFAWGPDEERKALLALSKPDPQTFVDGAMAWLAKCPVDIKVRVTLAGTLNQLDRSADALVQRYVYHGLLRSIVGDGDGLSEAKAFKVIAIDEEYDLCDYFGAKVQGQQVQGHFDVLEVMWKGKRQKFYFDISVVRENENKALGRKK